MTEQHTRTQKATMRMPGEWAQHELCLMAWPSRNYWQGIADFEDACAEWAGVANAIANFEPLLMAVQPGETARAKKMLNSSIEIIELQLNDAWMRDIGPLIVVGGQNRCGVHFRFNAWGEKFPPWHDDARVAEHLLHHLGIPRDASNMVLEGGAIAVDGQGTLITTSECLLNPNRNPSMNKAQMETELKQKLGVTNIIWLPYGQLDDRHTDGHVDGVLAFLAAGKVMVQSCKNPNHPDFKRSQANLEVLRASTDANNQPLEIVEVPYYPYLQFGQHTELLSYLNFYLAHGANGKAAIVPMANQAFDEPFKELLQHHLPDTQVLGVKAQLIAYGGGGPHCITQQIPMNGAV